MDLRALTLATTLMFNLNTSVVESANTEEIQQSVYELQYEEEQMNKLIDFLYKQVGKPYVWGASGTQAYDCSSLVQEAYRMIDVELARVSYLQAREGVDVPLENIRAGDIVTFVTSNRNNGDVTHVGIYVR